MNAVDNLRFTSQSDCFPKPRLQKYRNYQNDLIFVRIHADLDFVFVSEAINITCVMWCDTITRRYHPVSHHMARHTSISTFLFCTDWPYSGIFLFFFLILFIDKEAFPVGCLPSPSCIHHADPNHPHHKIPAMHTACQVCPTLPCTQPPPPRQNDWHMLVKTLPCYNFVCGR